MRSDIVLVMNEARSIRIDEAAFAFEVPVYGPGLGMFLKEWQSQRTETAGHGF